MPPRWDYGYDTKKMPASDEPTGVGHWHHGSFELAPGVGLADGQFVCPYGDHFVEISDWDGEEDGFYEGFCTICQRTVEIDYEPADALWRKDGSTSRKLWARLYYRVFGHWPQRVVDERLARLERRRRRDG